MREVNQFGPRKISRELKNKFNRKFNKMVHVPGY